MTVELPLQSQTSIPAYLCWTVSIKETTRSGSNRSLFILLRVCFTGRVICKSSGSIIPVLRANISQLQIIINLPSSQWKICPMIASLILTCLDAATFFPNPSTFSAVILKQFLCRNGLEWFRNGQMLRICRNRPISCILDNNSADWSWESGAPVMNGAAVWFHR